MIPEYPTTRVEDFLAKICGQDVALPTPQTRVEIFLANIAGENYVLPIPQTRVELFLAKILGLSVQTPVPQTRVELYLAKLAGEEIETPVPQTRIDLYLDEWAAGGGSVVETVTGSAPIILPNAVYGAFVSLTQYGKCTQDGTPTPSSPVDIVCNNGALQMVDDELPADYKRVLGFACDNNAMWEIAGFHLKGSDTVRISFSINGACNVFGCYQGADATDNYDLYASTSSGSKYFRYGSGTYLSYWSSSNLGQRFDVVYTPTGSQGMPQDSTWSALTFTSANDMLIGSTTLTGSSSKLKGNLYGPIVVDGRLNLIPCERVSDGALGYYDTYGATFYEPYEGFDGAVSLGYDGSHYSLTVVGTPEVLTINGITQIAEADIVANKGLDSTVGEPFTNTSRCYTGFGYFPAGTNFIIRSKANSIGGYLFQYSANDAVAANFISSIRMGDAVEVDGWYERRATTTRDAWLFAQYGAKKATAISDEWSALMPRATTSVPMLLSVGDYADEGEIISGGVTHRVGIKVFDGTEQFGKSSAYGVAFYIQSAASVWGAQKKIVMCSHYLGMGPATGQREVNTCFFNASGHFYIRVADNSDTAAFKADLAAKYASGNPVILLYALATETTEQTTPHSLHTTEGDNVVGVVSNVDPVELEVEYKAKA